MHPLLMMHLLEQELSISIRIELTLDETGTDVCWCGGVIKETSDGTWIIPTVSGRGKKCR